MIRVLSNGVRVVELGYGTTFVSPVYLEDDKSATVIAFSNKPYPVGSNSLVTGLTGDEVLIQIENFNGAMSYLKGLVSLMETWGINEEVRNQIDKLRDAINSVG